MKFYCNRERFYKGLSFVRQAIDAKNLIPVLNNILIRTVKKEDVFLMVYDYTLEALSDIGDDLIEILQKNFIGVKFTSKKSFHEALVQAFTKALNDSGKLSELPEIEKKIYDALDDYILLAASDTTMLTTTYVPASVDEEGEITVTNRLVNITREGSGEDVLLETQSNDWISFETGSYQSNLASLPSEQFVEIEDTSNIKYQISLKQEHLKEVLEKLRPVISRDDTREYFRGLCFFPYLDNESLGLASADTHRLAVIYTKEYELLNLEKLEFEQKLIGFKAVDNIVEICGSGNVRIAFTDKNVYLDFDGITKVTANLIDAKFPDFWKQISPDDETFFTLHIDREMLQQAIKRMALVTTEIERTAILNVDKTRNTMQISSRVTEIGNSQEDIPYTLIKNTWEKQDFTIGLNYRLLGEYLSMIPEKVIEMQLFQMLTPAYLCYKTQDYQFFYLIMPVRLKLGI